MAGQGARIWNAQIKIKESLKNSKKIGYNIENHEKYNLIFKKYKEFAGK